MNWEMVIAIVGIVELIASIVMAIALYLVAQKAAKIDKLSDEVSAKAESIIDARFEIFATKMQAAADSWDKVMQGIKERLAKGEHTFEKLGDETQENEVTLATVESRLQKWTMERFGTREEMAAIVVQIQNTQVKLAGFEASLKACRRASE